MTTEHEAVGKVVTDGVVTVWEQFVELPVGTKLYASPQVPKEMVLDKQEKNEQAPSNRDWPEDQSSVDGNGNYGHFCCNCKRYFIGHKRRLICKQCASPQVPEGMDSQRMRYVYDTLMTHYVTPPITFAEYISGIDKMLAAAKEK